MQLSTILRSLAVAVALSAGSAAAQEPEAGASARPVRSDHPAPSDFLEEATMAQVRLSPDGRNLAMIRRIGDRQFLFVQDLESGVSRPLIDLRWNETDGGQAFGGVYWKSEERLLVQISILTPVVQHGVPMFFARRSVFVAVNADGTRPVRLESANAFYQQDSLLDELYDDPNHVLMVHRDNGNDLSVSRLDLTTGERELVLRGDRGTASYFTNSDGQVVARIRFPGYGVWGVIEVRDPSQTRWIRVADYLPSDIRQTPDFQIVGSSPNPTEVYVLLRPQAGASPDTSAIHALDLRTQQSGPALFQNPRYDMAGVVTNPVTSEAVAGCYQADIWRCDFRDARLAAHMAGLSSYFEDSRNIRIVSQDREGQRWVVAVSGPDEPLSYYLYDVTSSSVEVIGDAYETMATTPLSASRRVDYVARDGVALHGYFTPPSRATAGPPALIVLPHGGPEARDALEYDPWVQFLASRGYAVFQPNFRGSSGFGRAFAEAGYRQWGARMQDDITDGVAALTESGTVDGSRICIMGASYGGYAALWGGASQPDLYRCVISIAGVGDLVEMLRWVRSTRGGDSDSFDYWETSIGQAGRDRDAVRAVSPINRVADWRPPVLLIHGVEDNVVPVEQSRRMARALRAAGRDVELLEIEDEGHHFRDRDHGAELLGAVDAFLAEHLPAD